MSAQVRPGYKLTEVGVIPESWESTNLGSVVQLQRGFDLPSRLRHIGDVPIVSSSGVTAAHNRAQAEGPGVVTGRYGTIGEVFYIETAYWPLNTTLYVKDFKGNCQKFIYYLLRTIDFQAHSGKSGVPGVNRNDLHQLLVAKPPLSQQEKIVEVLSDIDALISGLDQLIAKKRDIKQAAMQQLLTGHQRLPGFNASWVLAKAGEVGRFRGGSGFPIKYQGEMDGDYPFFKVSDMNNEGNDTLMESANNFVCENIRKAIGAALFPRKSIVFAKVGAAIFLERKKILSRESCLDNNMAAFVFDANKLDCRFVHYVFLNIRLSDLVSTTALPSLSGSVLSSIEMRLPLLDEQTAIATVLSDMDAELAALEQRRDKAKLLKQGMMQELLTGRIRLV